MAANRLVHALAALALAASSVLVTAATADASTVTTLRSDASTDVDDFSYSSWEARYEIGIDDDGRSTMHVTETLTAEFPEFDQNRGIVRGLPTSYRDAWLDTQVISVTDQSGARIPWETDEDDGLIYVLTGDDDFVHGPTTYVIDYRMRDVVLAADTGVDEFYWDLLPLDSTQPIDAFRADIEFDRTMASGLTGDSRCYVGYSGSTAECTLSADGSRFTVSQDGLSAGEGVTVAIGLESGTAVQPDARTPNAVSDIGPAAAAGAALALSVGSWFAVGSFKKSRRTADGVIVAQYDVPTSLPPLLAAAVMPQARDAISAEILHLAVRGRLHIEEGDSTAQPRLRLLPEGHPLDPLDDEALDALFLDASDDTAEIPASSEEYASRMTMLLARGSEEATARGLVTVARSRAAMIIQWCAIAVATAGFAIGLWAIIAGRVTAVPAFVAICFGLFLVLLSGFYAFSTHSVLTTEGARAYEYLKGVEEFIRVAEADRLRMLQSYSGAERRADGTADVILVYERLLPYAVLFGMEYEWGTVLENIYAEQRSGAPWIGSPAAPFHLWQLSALTTASQAGATYSAPATATSSAAGGSFGGGFSGGGGGGGFSGGR